MTSESRAARTELERNWHYDVVVLNADNKMKLACVKVLRELLPEFGLKQQLEFVQSEMPVAASDVDRRVARRVRDCLLGINAEASMRSTVSTAPKLKSRATVPELRQNAVVTESLRQHTLSCEVALRVCGSHVGCDCSCH